MPTIVTALVRAITAAALIGVVQGALCAPAQAVPSRIKDIAGFEGVRDNMLVARSELRTMPAIGAGPATEGTAPRPGREAMETVAGTFEAVFIAQMLQSLTSDLERDGPLGGGDGDPFPSMLTGEIAKLISRAGGIGVGDAVLQEMLKMQEVA